MANFCLFARMDSHAGSYKRCLYVIVDIIKSATHKDIYPYLTIGSFNFSLSLRVTRRASPRQCTVKQQPNTARHLRSINEARFETAEIDLRLLDGWVNGLHTFVQNGVAATITAHSNLAHQPIGVQLFIGVSVVCS